MIKQKACGQRILVRILLLAFVLLIGDRISLFPLRAESYVLGSEDLSETEEEMDAQMGMTVSQQATVTLDGLTLYSDETGLCEAGSLRQGQVVEIQQTAGMWCLVKAGEAAGYVMKDCLQIHNIDYNAVVEYGKTFLGNPYVWGGTSLTKGCDCSAFIMRIYEHFGVSVPRSSYFQRTAGMEVKDLQDAQPGDIICYKNHVAMYIGNDQILHAKGRKSGIVITDGADYRQILSIRRIF